ncbi:hypothetical protein [Rheinheimera sp. EpRS3]|uniref:hypothetical protein n=1 Tax=Rheinheimera sp. EpRS3 TaxID=1712383 RepID=UPI0007463D75|nr:hypothetical protein [Rheinheimera sp. EpRS3]KUM52073.1 hypothetical protein AR688_01820 [Rheinheimera sp. EpRS3]
MDIDKDFLSVEQILDKFTGFNWYLYSQNAAWLEPTKVNIYYGVWRRFIRSLGRNVFSLSKESFFVDPDKGLKNYGLSEINLAEREFVASNLAGDFDNCLIISARELDEIFVKFESKFKDVFANEDFFCKEEKFDSLVEFLHREDYVVIPSVYNDQQGFHVVPGRSDC